MSQIKKGAVLSYSAIFLNIMAGLLYTPWMVRHIGMSDYGLYALIGTFMSYFLIDFGLGQTIVRFISTIRAKGEDKREVERLIATTAKIYFGIDLVIVLTLFIAFFFLSGIFRSFSEVELHKFKVIYCIAGLFSIMNFPFIPQDGILMAYERFVILKSTQMMQKLGIVCLMVVALILGYGLYALVLVNGAVALSLSFYKFRYIKKRINVHLHFRIFDKILAKQLLSFSMWVFVMALAQQLIFNLAPVLIGIFSGTTQIAIFSIGLTIEAFTYTIAGALNDLFIPKVARLSFENKTREDVNKLMLKVGRIQLLIVGIVVTGIIVLGKSFILLWMGTKFIDSYLIVLCLIIPDIITFTQAIAYSLLFVENKIQYRAIIFISAASISVVIDVLLIPHLGALGAAVSAAIALILCHVIAMNIVYAKVLKLNITDFFKKCHLRMIPTMVLSGVISLILQRFIIISGWIGLIIQGFLFLGIYYTLMWLISMNQYEKALTKQLVLSTVHKIKAFKYVQR